MCIHSRHFGTTERGRIIRGKALGRRPRSSSSISHRLGNRSSGQHVPVEGNSEQNRKSNFVIAMRVAAAVLCRGCKEEEGVCGPNSFSAAGSLQIMRFQIMTFHGVPSMSPPIGFQLSLSFFLHKLAKPQQFALPLPLCLFVSFRLQVPLPPQYKRAPTLGDLCNMTQKP